MASFASNAAILGSPHRDVLEATPDTDESKDRLVEELKSRAKAAVGTKDWMNASLLYQKAITMVPNEATLHSNLSLCQYNMGDFGKACDSATQAVATDAKFVKGYWRLGQAWTKLENYEEALAAHQKGLVYEPTNKAIQKEIEKLKKLAAEEKERKRLLAAAEEEANKMEVDDSEAPLPSSKTTANGSRNAPPKKNGAKTATTTNTESIRIDDEVDFTKSDHVKGYKVVNGKKTSYFHNELTEEAKALIGDIAPKRLETVPQPAPATDIPSGSSAWNKAGTWEEKDVTAWAQESLDAALLAAVYTLADSSPAPGALCTVESSKSSGHASVAIVRAKKRYIYEFAITIKWKFAVGNDKACGSMSFPDFDGTCELGQGYDLVEWSVDESSSASLTPLLERFVRNGGLRDVIHQALDDWVRRFRDTY
jgi:tetratricopeptide (TPR) repeat protein